MATNQITIFYSWQSDVKDNRIIREALKTAITSVKAKLPAMVLEITIDEATRDLPGSPNIPNAIFSKIRQCDIFLADITTINNDTAATARRVPNPNVAVELGYTIGTLGWGRTILLFNNSFGSFPSDVPFDFDRHRIGQFTYRKVDTNGDKVPKSVLTLQENALMKLLTNAIKLIIEVDPEKIGEGCGLNVTEVRRNRDIKQIGILMSTIHLPTLDELCNEAPHSIHDKAFVLFEHFEAIVDTSLFHLNDQNIEELVRIIHKEWSYILSQDAHYHPAPSGRLYIFTNPGDLPLPPKKQKIWDLIDCSRRELYNAYNLLVKYLREKYVEVNISETNEHAWKLLVEYRRAIKEH